MAGKILTDLFNDGEVVRLTLNAPKGNILDREMMSELQAALDRLHDQPSVKLVQFAGAGDHFSFGASVPDHAPDRVSEMLKQFHRLFYTLMKLAIPSAAIISGRCLGGGLELALICNFLFVDRTARLGQPETTLGVFPPPASLILPLRIGQTKADEFILTGRTFSAGEMENVGLVTGLYEDRKSLHAGVEAWVEEHIIPKSASSLRYAVRAARWEFNESLSTLLGELERFYLDELMSSHDAHEGISAFMEKRKPRWKNR